MRDIAWRSLVAAMAIVFALGAPAVQAAVCDESADVVAGGSVEIGRMDSSEFDISKQPKQGTLSIKPKSSGFSLVYTARAESGDISDEAICAVKGQPPATVKLRIAKAATVASDKIYGATAKALVLLFALAVVLESALAGLFRWRPFVELLNPRAVRPLVAVIVSWFFVSFFGLDIITGLVNASRPPEDPMPVTGVGQFITALVLAGGSSGVNSILVALGFRQVATPETVAPKPDASKAWIAVRATRKDAAPGDINVFIGPPEKLSNGELEPPYAGTIRGESKRGLLAYFTRDEGRFPNYGGYEVEAGKEICIVLVGPKKPGAATEPSATWGPHRPASRAIIDIELDV